MPTDLSKKTALILDSGLFVSIAIRLAKDFGKVYYCNPTWLDAFPRMNKAYIGAGFNEIEVIPDIESVKEKISLWVFPDLFFGPLQVSLEAEGHRVWGARMGEELELCRDCTKRLMATLNLPLGPWRKVKGIKALREFLKANKDQFVKVNKWRGLSETFKSPDYRSSEPKLDELEYNLGAALKEEIDFIVEDSLPDRVEIGYDGYTIDGVYPKKSLAGIEVKNLAYVGKFQNYSDLPPALTDFNRAISHTFANYGYRGFYSNEVRIGKDKIPYMVDLCARAASPPSELYQEFYKNISEILWEGAGGNCIDPEPEGKFGAQIRLVSTWAEQNPQPVDFPEELSRYIKLVNVTKRSDGRIFVIPQTIKMAEIGSIIGWGDTIKAAVEMVREIGEEVKGHEIHKSLAAFDEADEEIAKLESFGVKLF